MTNRQRRFPIYSRLLRLYPPDYHSKYADQMVQTLEDMLDGAGTRGAKAAVYVRASIDLPFSIAKQQLLYTGGVMSHTMPNYIKLSSLFGVLMVVPFFVFVVIDSLTRHSLEHSFFWHTPVLFTWLIILPAVAVAVNAAALSRWLWQRNSTGFWRRLLDIRHDWPPILVAIIGLGIIGLALFHDSAHCVIGNPIREIQNVHQTWQCVRRS